MMLPLLRRSYSTQRAIQSVMVLGGGLMGSGIVQVAAQAGYKVTMVDTSEKALDNGRSIIQKSLARVARKKFADSEESQREFIQSVFANINTSTDTTQVASTSDLIVEAIVENLDVKQKVFSSMDKVAPAHCIFTSNTSSLPITKIAEITSSSRQERFAGLHFFNPVPAMKLVEVVRTDAVSDPVFDALFEFSTKVGKSPVACKDTPGFIVNRLLVPYMMEAFRIIDRGEASAKDIDTAMKLGAGMPMGPIELADFVGLDTMKFIVDGWKKEGSLDPALVKSSNVLDEMVSQGRLGRKSGQGFFEYK
ncbi:3-hydroxyacyl-CoA dehydrogenase [Spinellus fusiger]|nr:3-hydroxyacyl-CoA dehydrogenase [Spinellus fusiger]